MPSSPKLKPPRQFDAQAFLASAGVARRVIDFRKNTVIYTQGDAADIVFYIQQGNVKLSVVSPTGKEAVVGMLRVGDFFGEGCLAGQRVRMGTATTRTATSTANGNKVVPSLIKGMRVKLREALGLTQDDNHAGDTVAPNGNDPQSGTSQNPDGPESGAPE